MRANKWNIRIGMVLLFLVVGMDSMPAQAATKHPCAYEGCTRKVSKDETYCSKHTKKVSKENSKKKSSNYDSYYEDDPEAFYEDNKDLYDSFDEAMDDWEDEYGDDY